MGNIYKIEISIRMPKYLQHFITYRFLRGKASCDAKNEFNSFLAPLLEVYPHHKTFVKKDMENKDEVFTVELPTIKGKDALYYNWMTDESNNYLIMVMRKMFNMLLMEYMANSCSWYLDERTNKIKICHSERPKAIEQWCWLNGIPSHLINVDTFNRYFTIFLRDKKQDILAGRQLSMNLVSEKEYTRKKTSKVKYADLESYQFNLSF